MGNPIFFIITLLVTSFIISCTPPIVFTEPQPQGYESSLSFPPIYRGLFLCDSDSAIVHVTDKLFYKEKEYSVALSKSDIEDIDELKLLEDQLQVSFLKELVPAEIRGDSVFTQITLRDTFFNLGKNQILTQFRGHQILNKKLNTGDWEVLILSLNQNSDLILSTADIPQDLERLNEITLVEKLSKGDTLQYRVGPTVYEFNQILKEQLIFEPCDYYKRIKLALQIY